MWPRSIRKRNLRITSKAGTLRYFSPRFTHILKITQRYNESELSLHQIPGLRGKKKCLGLQIKGPLIKALAFEFRLESTAHLSDEQAKNPKGTILKH